MSLEARPEHAEQIQHQMAAGSMLEHDLRNPLATLKAGRDIIAGQVEKIPARYRMWRRTPLMDAYDEYHRSLLQLEGLAKFLDHQLAQRAKESPDAPPVNLDRFERAKDAIYAAIEKSRRLAEKVRPRVERALQQSQAPPEQREKVLGDIRFLLDAIHFDRLKTRVDQFKLDEKLQKMQVGHLRHMVTNAEFHIPEPTIELWAFPSNVAIALQNLVDNAHKYGALHWRQHGIEPKVTVGAEQTSKNKIRFWVEDNGPGIPPEIAAKMFHEKVSTTGSGLGTVFVSEAVERHKGTEPVIETHPGRTRISFELPKESQIIERYGFRKS